MGWRVGVDIGGTFTDFCLLDDRTGRLFVWKVPSTPEDPSKAVVQGLQEFLARQGITGREISHLGHGTTVSTNAVLQHRGARTGLITTRGFKDLLMLARQKRPHLYDLQADKPVELVARRLAFEARERVLYTGEVHTPLVEEDVREAAAALRGEGVEAVAVCFLHSYANPEHESTTLRILQTEFPEAYLSVSHQVISEFREFERLSTTVMNAYVGPIMRRYLENLADKIRAVGVEATPFICAANGGVMSIPTATQRPVTTVGSGPAAGVIGATYLGQLIGRQNLITLDIGGTSTDVCLIREGRPEQTGLATVRGYPVRGMVIDVHSIGAGGGSVAWIDSGGLLKVGPESAGAVPGPACYGLGGTRPTVTDAHVVLQRLVPGSLLAGRLSVDAKAAERAVDSITGSLAVNTTAAALGILRVLESNVVRAVRVISTERGYDPREFSLVAFGGAGPLHAASVAAELGIRTVLVPYSPGILCAIGLLTADVRRDFSMTYLRQTSEVSSSQVRDQLERLQQEAFAWLSQEGLDRSRMELRCLADMRYVGQNYEITVPIDLKELDGDALAPILVRFYAEHEKLYGHAAEGELTQFVALRVSAQGKVPKPSFREGEARAKTASTRTRRVYFTGKSEALETTVLARDSLDPGRVVSGPAIIEQYDSTTVIPPGWRASVDEFRNLILEPGVA